MKVPSKQINKNNKNKGQDKAKLSRKPIKEQNQYRSQLFCSTSWYPKLHNEQGRQEHNNGLEQR